MAVLHIVHHITAGMSPFMFNAIAHQSAAAKLCSMHLLETQSSGSLATAAHAAAGKPVSFGMLTGAERASPPAQAIAAMPCGMAMHRL